MSSLAVLARGLKRRSSSSSSRRAMERPPIAPELSTLSRLRSLRWSTILVAIANAVVTPMASFLGVKIAAQCGFNVALPFLVVASLAAARMASMVGTGIAQESTAITILNNQLDDAAAEAVVRQDRRLKYKRWLWWTRFGMLITLLQFCAAGYLVFIIMKEFSLGQKTICSGGFALLQKHGQAAVSHDQLTDAPDDKIREAAEFHQFAEAAYTGPLLDFGRNPVLFPCAWLFRQGILAPWACHRRPLLEGDNWWRGHAAAFLKFVDLPPSVLRRGRVIQVKREAAYFVVVLHHLSSVVISVRGTETPEDLLTDGLCRECILTDEDLDGLIKYLSFSISPKGHGFLSSLMGSGSECHGYNIRIVGHSLGGAVATLLGIRLCRKYPNLQVYSYGTLPCVDPVIAEACSDFVTSIIYNDEFSARLSICSVLRLRAAAIAALAQDSSANSATICKLARRIMRTKQSYETEEKEIFSSPYTGNLPAGDGSQTYRRRQYKYAVEGNEPAQGILIQENAIVDISTSEKCADFFDENFFGPNHDSRACPGAANDLFSSGDLVQISDGETSTQPSKQEPQEVFLPGLIIHIIPESRKTLLALCKSWKGHGEDANIRAYIASRETFKDLVVSPYMFLDHLPWRCHYALQRVLEVRGICGELEDKFLCEDVTV
ncbi:unnamed protein product [Victoria cruziana]